VLVASEPVVVVSVTSGDDEGPLVPLDSEVVTVDSEVKSVAWVVDVSVVVVDSGSGVDEAHVVVDDGSVITVDCSVLDDGTSLVAPVVPTTIYFGLQLMIKGTLILNLL